MYAEPETIFSTSVDMDTLGGRLSRARYATGMSVAELARRIGVRTSTLQAWENDRAEPRANRLQMIAGLLGVSLSWLLGGIGEPPADDPQDGPVRSALAHLERARRLHAELGLAIAQAEREMGRIERLAT